MRHQRKVNVASYIPKSLSDLIYTSRLLQAAAD